MNKEQIEAVRSYLMDLDCPIPEADANAVCDLALKALHDGAVLTEAVRSEPVAEVMEIIDAMDSYVQRPEPRRSIIPYRPIGELPVGTKL